MRNLLIVFHILLILSIVGCATKPKGVYVGEKKDGERHGVLLRMAVDPLGG